MMHNSLEIIQAAYAACLVIGWVMLAYAVFEHIAKGE